MKDLPINDDAAALLGISISGKSDNNSNKGFNNRPLNSNESYNNPETVSKDCETKKIGDYCFQNNTKFNLEVNIDTDNLGYAKYSCTLLPEQKQCFYNLPIGPSDYWISNQKKYSGYDVNNGGNSQDIYKANGQINIEQCKSKTFVIR